MITAVELNILWLNSEIGSKCAGISTGCGKFGMVNEFSCQMLQSFVRMRLWISVKDGNRIQVGVDGNPQFVQNFFQIHFRWYDVIFPMVFYWIGLGEQ